MAQLRRVVCHINDCLYSVPPEIQEDEEGRPYVKCKYQLFQFPSDPYKHCKWMEAVGRMLFDFRSARICKHHFAPSDFCSGKLSLSAVPSLDNDYPRRPPTPVLDAKPSNIMNMLVDEAAVKRKPPAPKRKRSALKRKPSPANEEGFFGPPDDFDSDSDSDLEGIVASELGLSFDRRKNRRTLSDDEVGVELGAQPIVEDEESEEDKASSDEEVQMELIKLMAKKEEGPSSPPPSPNVVEDDSLLNSPSPEPEDDTTRLFRSLELIYRSVHPEVQAVTKENLFSVMKMAKKMDDDLKRKQQLVVRRRVFNCSAPKR